MVTAQPGAEASVAISRYAVTGSFAATRIAPIVAPQLVACFVDRPEAAAEALGLVPADSGANVLLVEPFDEVVYERAGEQDGIAYAAPSQVAADLLGGPGRNPAEAEALMDWMEGNGDAWRG
jgi:hypothetical protein